MQAILADNYFWLPRQASTVARSTDNLFNFVLWVSVFFFLLITVLLVAFVIKYRHKPGEKRDVSASHSMTLELTWTIIPSILCVFLYYYGFKEYMNLAVEPPNAYEVTVTGKMWQWQFDYPNGAQSTELHCVVNKPVRCVLQSNDVIHSMFVPAFRVKKDVVPGRYNRLWFQATSQEGMLYLVGVPSGGGTIYAASDENGNLLPTTNQPNGQDPRPSQGATKFVKLPPALQAGVLSRTGLAKIAPDQTFPTIRMLNGSNLYAITATADGKTSQTLVDDSGNAVTPPLKTFGELPREIQTSLQSQSGSNDLSKSQVFAFPDAEAFDILCADYCGTNHSTMHSRVVVHRTQADFDIWMKLANDDSAKPILERGLKYYTTQGCAQCHSVDGSRITGPSWKDLFGSTQHFTDGSTAVVDADFVHEFVLNPTKRTPVAPAGQPAYPPGAMPVLPIKSEQVDAIIAYMKTISENYHGPAPSTTQATTAPATEPAK